jgi:hypothetical protein
MGERALDLALGKIVNKLYHFRNAYFHLFLTLNESQLASLRNLKDWSLIQSPCFTSKSRGSRRKSLTQGYTELQTTNWLLLVGAQGFLWLVLLRSTKPSCITLLGEEAGWGSDTTDSPVVWSHGPCLAQLWSSSGLTLCWCTGNSSLLMDYSAASSVAHSSWGNTRFCELLTFSPAYPYYIVWCALLCKNALFIIYSWCTGIELQLVRTVTHAWRTFFPQDTSHPLWLRNGTQYFSIAPWGSF